MGHPYGPISRTDILPEAVGTDQLEKTRDEYKIKSANVHMKYGSAQIIGLTLTISHGLGVTPKVAQVTQLSSAYIGTVYKQDVDDTNLRVATTTSGSIIEWTVWA